jgi:hypothetical protein
MIPDVQIVLSGIARSALMDLGATATTRYAGFTAELMSALLMMIGQEHDRAAARLQEENEALVSLFHGAASSVADKSLQAQCAATTAAAPSLRVSDLRQRNTELRALLIRLHIHVEGRDGDGARDIEAKVWSELVASTRRRHLDLSNG